MMAGHVRARLEAIGLTLTLAGNALQVQPASLLSDETRALIRAHKGALVDLLSAPAAVEPELRALILRVAAYFKVQPDELALILAIAERDPEAARESCEDTARRGWIV